MRIRLALIVSALLYLTAVGWSQVEVVPARFANGPGAANCPQGIATTSTDCLILQNTTAATAGTTIQYSGRLKWCGTGYNSVAVTSETDCWAVDVQPTTAAGTTAVSLIFNRSVAGGAFANPITFGSSGSLTLTGGMSLGGTSAVTYSGRSLLKSPLDGEFDIVANAATIQAGIRSRLVVEANTGAKSPSALESNELYTNTGDADGSTITLLNDPTAGITYRVAVTASQTITIAASAGETFQYGASTCGTSLTSNTVGSAVTITAAVGGSGGIWVTTTTVGVWTCNA